MVNNVEHSSSCIRSSILSEQSLWMVNCDIFTPALWRFFCCFEAFLCSLHSKLKHPSAVVVVFLDYPVLWMLLWTPVISILFIPLRAVSIFCTFDWLIFSIFSYCLDFSHRQLSCLDDVSFLKTNVFKGKTQG